MHQVEGQPAATYTARLSLTHSIALGQGSGAEDYCCQHRVQTQYRAGILECSCPIGSSTLCLGVGNPLQSLTHPRVLYRARDTFSFSKWGWRDAVCLTLTLKEWPESTHSPLQSPVCVPSPTQTLAPSLVTLTLPPPSTGHLDSPSVAYKGIYLRVRAKGISNLT